MPGGIFDHLDFIAYLATFALAINQFTQPSHCSSSFSIPTNILSLLSLLPTIYASALFVKDSLGGFPRRNGTLAYVKLSDEGIYIPLRGDSEQRCPGHLDTNECPPLPEASLLDGLSRQSAASLQPSSAQFKRNETNHRDAALLSNPHALASIRGVRVGDTSPVKASTHRNSHPSPRKVVDLELSAVGRYLARQFGMFVWRIHPLIHAYNGLTGLDASFRRLDMFMHSPRAGMLYHEMIIFVDHAAIPRAGSGDSRLQATWQMYAARTRACDLSNLGHTYFPSVDGDKSDAGDPEEWQNCLQWDALMTRVLNAAYMRRTREAVIQRWEADARQYWRHVEGLSEAGVDRVAKAVSTYGLKSPVEVASDSSGSEVDRGIQNGPKLACDGDSEREDGFFEDKLEGVIDPSSCSPDLECGWDEATNDRGAEVNDALYEFDFEEELRGGYSDVGLGHDLEFKCDGGFGPEFESLDSVLSDATPPPASLTPSSSEASSADMDSECILYPRLMPTSIPTSHPGQTQFLAGPRLGPRTAIYTAVTEESPSFATSDSPDRTVDDFSAFSLSLSTKTSTGMNVWDNCDRPPLSSNPRVASGLTSQSQPAPARPYEPSLLDLALALGTRGSEERLRKRELTSSSSYPSPPPSPLPQLPEDRYPQVPQDMGEESTIRDTVCIHPNQSTRAFGSFNPAEELTQDSSWTQTDTSPPASASKPPPSSKKLRVVLNLTFKNPPLCDPLTTPTPVPADPKTAIPRMRTAFSLWDAIMRPQGAPPIHPSGPRSAGVDMQSGDLDPAPNFQLIYSTTIDCERKAACLQAQSLHGLVGVCSQGTGVGAGESLDQSDWERRLVAGGDGGTARRGGEKARRQGERRRIRIEVTQARDTERSTLVGAACAD